QTDSVTRLGYHARASHDLVDITVCPILVPAIADALDGLRSLARMLALADGRLKVGVTATDVGLDVHVNGAGNAPDADLSARLAAHAQATGIARLIVDNTDIVQFAAPRIAVDNVDIPVPTGVFLQAAAPAEAVMIAAVCDAVGKARDVADLFCGVGTFALPLSRTAKVTAIDGESRAIAALDAAKRNTQGRKAVTARVRDLFREPLSRKELEPFEAVVIDPPRAGAKAQSEALAKSEVGRIAAVSCNPATFARDAEILAAGGYDLAWVQPIDQFVYAPHVELVAAFMRPDEKRRGGKGRGRGLRRR
ncbi:MAG: methyltransferase, partial [Pseudomonadota bacterium]